MDSKALEEFRCGLLSFGEPSTFLDILLPPEKKIKHDHTYSLPPQSEHETNWALLPSIEESSTFEDDELTVVQSDEMTLQCLLVKLNLRVTPHERQRVEMETRSQSLQPEWHCLRYKRITGSKCGRILIQKKKTVALITYCLYPKPLDPLPAPMVWGQHHESIAIQKYIASKNQVTVKKCGFIIHPRHGWLGASPDGRVVDRLCNEAEGILEIKCPFSKRDVTPLEACQDINFYCEAKNSAVTLKKNHAYYHQVRLQLYVGSDLYKWCDFCVYTTKGMSIQRILPDPAWQCDSISKLESFFDNYLLPEIVFPKYKSNYVI